MALRAPATSFKNLRDEFDPLHDNTRRGWHQRPLRSNRQLVLADFCDASDDALMEFVEAIFRGESEVLTEAVDILSTRPRFAQNVAERLLTGRLAEDYFLKHSQTIVGFDGHEILDLRWSARGYDFGIRSNPEIAIETKGLNSLKGEILFTDREWAEAKTRRTSYWLVVVGNVGTEPSFRVFLDPHATLDVKCRHRTSITASWHSHVSLARS